MINGQASHKIESHIFDNDWNGKRREKNPEVELHIVFLTLYLLHSHTEENRMGAKAIMNHNSQRHLYPNDLTT